MPLQLDFFISEREVLFNTIIASLSEVKHSSDKVRRGTYASIGELKKELIDVRLQLEHLKKEFAKEKCNGDCRCLNSFCYSGDQFDYSNHFTCPIRYQNH